MKKVFGDEYCDEENQLKTSLAVFLFTYALRATLTGVLILWTDVYFKMWEGAPLWTETLYIFCQLVYDTWPLGMVFRQHHRHYSAEQRETTSLLMRDTSTTSPMSRE